MTRKRVKRAALAMFWLTGLVALTRAEVPDTMAQRVLACTSCHGAQGRSSPAGYLPRIAGKPAGYLYQQLENFRNGDRQHRGMATLLAPLTPAYLREIAEHFAGLDIPYAAPAPSRATAQQWARGESLVRQGQRADASGTVGEMPACASCHGAQLTGRMPAVPGLLGLPPDYLIAQLGAWRQGLRRAKQPDCMAALAKRLSPEDITAVALWLGAQKVPLQARPEPPRGEPWPMPCGAAD